MRRLFAVAILPMTIACESPSSGEGELGNVHYSLSSRHSVPGELTEVGIVTGHPQLLETALTEQGAKNTNRPKSTRHFISGGGRAENQDGADALPDVVLTVSTPGTYLLETLNNEGLLDKIELTFAAPNQVGLQTWVKGPDATDFNERNAPSVPVEVGAQVALLPIPLRGQQRLAGGYELDLSVEPPSAGVVPADVQAVYEQSGWWSHNERSVIFVEEGEVVVTLTDVPNGISTSQTFLVGAGD